MPYVVLKWSILFRVKSKRSISAQIQSISHRNGVFLVESAMVLFVNVRLKYKIASKMAVFGQNCPFYFKNIPFLTNSDQIESKLAYFGSFMVIFDIKCRFLR